MANLDIYKVNLDTPQPNGRKGESPRAAFTKYNDLIEALGNEIEQAGFYVSQTPPDTPVSYMQWVDTSVEPAVLRRWDSAEDEWVEIGPVLRSLGTLSELNVGAEADEVRTNSENDTRFIQGGDVVQTTGDSPDDVMSQKAATEAFVHQDAATKMFFGRFTGRKVSELEYPLYISHRGGSFIYPEQSMLGFKESAKSGFLPEMDIQALSDGTLVLSHDYTVDRTMVGVRGDMSNITKEEWAEAKIINTHTKAVAPQPAVFFEDLLDEMGGSIVLVPEIKDSAIEYSKEIINAVKERGLEEYVIIQSFDYEVCREVASEGLHALYLFNGVPSETPSEIAGDGIGFVGPKWDSISANDISSFQSEGIKVVGYTVNTIADRKDFVDTNGADGVFSDDCWGLVKKYSNTTTTYFKKGVGLRGAVAQSLDVGAANLNKILKVKDVTSPANGEGLGFFNDFVKYKNTVLHMPEMGRINLPVKIIVKTLSGVVGPANEDTPNDWGIILTKPNGDDLLFSDYDPSGRYGVTAIAAGSIWVFDGGSSATKVSGSEYEHVFKSKHGLGSTFEIDITENSIKMKCYETGMYSENVEPLDLSGSNYKDMVLGLRVKAGVIIDSVSILPSNQDVMFPITSGSVVESGESSSGKWVKWADGTMWCQTSTVLVEGGSGDYRRVTAGWPQNFKSAPRMANAYTDSTVYGATVQGVNASDCTATSVTISVYRTNSTSTLCMAEAMGRWK